jgi:glycosyltransferase involved in cell wall biosynthesis
MKILLSALACEPGKGSELEVGFRTVIAVAKHHEVWVLTNAATTDVVRSALGEFYWAARVHLVGIHFEVDDELYPRLTPPGFHFYYDRWQRRAAAKAVELDRQIQFDLVHHITLAACWTRAGAAVLNKPLVWGPVGGGVNPPLSLLSELGWRGIYEEVGRFVTRRALGVFGPARIAARKAAFTFVQNEETARVLSSTGPVRVLSNATCVHLQPVQLVGPRCKDIIFASRLLPWKGGKLALRAFRYVTDPAAMLRIFGEGPDRHRLARAARRWGLADRVKFEGKVPRAALMQTIAHGGVCLHPALHDEAGLAVAEALSLGTPVVCLTRGGPPALFAQWPHVPAISVTPGRPEPTARAIAEAVDTLLQKRPPIRPVPSDAAESFEDHVLTSYDAAIRNIAVAPVWGFPAGKPQVFAATPQALSRAVAVYGFGRRLPVWVHKALAWQVRIPALRRFTVDKSRGPEPVCGWLRWMEIRRRLIQRMNVDCVEWVQFSSQWGKGRSSVLGLGRDGAPTIFAVVEPAEWIGVRPPKSTGSFSVPACLDTFQADGWTVRAYEPLPRFHRPASWNLQRIRLIAGDIGEAVAAVLPLPATVSRDWQPMHGDFVPWNLRQDALGRCWLIDWEDAGWGPPLADLLRYVVAHYSLLPYTTAAIVARVNAAFAGDSPERVSAAARFWLAQPNLQPMDGTGLARLKAKDAARVQREFAVFTRLATDGPEHQSERMSA